MSEEKDKESPKLPIPTLRDSRPQLKIKGLTTNAMSLIDRLKQFKKKDLTFILAGLGVVFMAPLAEHFMMSPDTGDTNGAFKEGWGFRDSSGALGKGGSPYESGVNGLAPGGLLGGGSDVITPLNVRDPSALVMGPGATPQAPVSSPQPPAPQKSASSDWKDALANAAQDAGKKALKSASLPGPRPPLQGALRGLGAVSGGGGGSYGLPPISAANVPNRAADHAMARALAPTGYRGAATSRGQNSPDTGGLDALKKAAGLAAGEMNRGGSAAGNLDNAAQASNGLPSGSSNGGAGEGGASNNEKNPSQGSLSGSKNQGESLQFLLAKERAEKDLELEYKKKEKEDMDLNVWFPLRDSVVKGFGDGFNGLIGGMFKAVGNLGGNKVNIICTVDQNGKQGVYPQNAISECAASGGDSSKGTAGGPCYWQTAQGGDMVICNGPTRCNPPYAFTGCQDYAGVVKKDTTSKPGASAASNPVSELEENTDANYKQAFAAAQKTVAAEGASVAAGAQSLDAACLSAVAFLEEVDSPDDKPGVFSGRGKRTEWEQHRKQFASLKDDRGAESQRGHALVKSAKQLLAASKAMDKTVSSSCLNTRADNKDFGIAAPKGYRDIASALMKSEAKINNGAGLLQESYDGASKVLGGAKLTLDALHLRSKNADNANATGVGLGDSLDTMYQSAVKMDVNPPAGKPDELGSAWDGAYRNALSISGSISGQASTKESELYKSDKVDKARKAFDAAAETLGTIGGYNKQQTDMGAQNGTSLGKVRDAVNEARTLSASSVQSPILVSLKTALTDAGKPDGSIGQAYEKYSQRYKKQAQALADATGVADTNDQSGAIYNVINFRATVKARLTSDTPPSYTGYDKQVKTELQRFDANYQTARRAGKSPAKASTQPPGTAQISNDPKVPEPEHTALNNEQQAYNSLKSQLEADDQIGSQVLSKIKAIKGSGDAEAPAVP